LLEDFGGVSTLLEVGSDTGHFAKWSAESRFNLVGLDRAPAMVREARRSFPLLPLVLGDAERLPFLSGLRQWTSWFS
jgi:ubiquinone/menaquinone biosynthesis C-methylase UbiE